MKTLKIASIVTGIVLAVGMGIASAEPMELTGSQMDDVTGGHYGFCYWCPGSSADASAYASSYGSYSNSSAHTGTFSAPGASTASSSSSSCTNTGC
jgi:hypothetical protein